MNDKVSIIIPVYNCERYVRGCIESIQKQTHKNIEIILVNDGSKDSSEVVCQTFASTFENIMYYYQENTGVSVARNNGLIHASGDYIMFVDADDRIKPTIIEELLSVLDEDTDVACCSYEILDPTKSELMYDKEIDAKSIAEKEPFFLQLMDYTYGHDSSNATAIGVPWAKLYRKSFLDKAGIYFDSSLRRMQDNIFVMEAFFNAKRVRYIPRSLYLYRVEHINSYNTVSYNPEVYLGVLARRHEFFERHPEILTDKIKDYFYKEHINYLMMSIHYIVAQKNNKDESVKKIEVLCTNDIYKTILNRIPTRSVSNKQKVQWVLFKLHAYGLLYYVYKKKYNH